MGRHFHYDGEFMKEMVQVPETQPLSFHMNWNNDKDVKQKFLEQLGAWHVKSVCVGGEMLSQFGNSTKGRMLEACCSSQPLVSCHFRDKPSLIPCKDSPAFENSRRGSFW